MLVFVAHFATNFPVSIRYAQFPQIHIFERFYQTVFYFVMCKSGWSLQGWLRAFELCFFVWQDNQMYIFRFCKQLGIEKIICHGFYYQLNTFGNVKVFGNVFCVMTVYEIQTVTFLYLNS